MYRRTDRRTDGRADRQTDGRTDRQADGGTAAQPHPADFVLLAVVIDDGFGLVVERLLPLLYRLLVAIDSTTRLSTLQQALSHRVFGHIKVQHM